MSGMCVSECQCVCVCVCDVQAKPNVHSDEKLLMDHPLPKYSNIVQYNVKYVSKHVDI